MKDVRGADDCEGHMTFFPTWSPEVQNDSDLRLQMIRPKNVKGRRQVRNKTPNRSTMERARLSANIDEFVQDATTSGYMASDGNGGVTRVQLVDVSEPVLLHLVDNGTVSMHFAIKDEAKKQRRIVGIEKAYRDALNRPITAYAIRNAGNPFNITIIDGPAPEPKPPTEQQIKMEESMKRDANLLLAIQRREANMQERARAAKLAANPPKDKSKLAFTVTLVN